MEPLLERIVGGKLSLSGSLAVFSQEFRLNGPRRYQFYRTLVLREMLYVGTSISAVCCPITSIQKHRCKTEQGLIKSKDFMDCCIHLFLFL